MRPATSAATGVGAPGFAGRLLHWLHTPSDLAILGLAWLVVSLPVATATFATSALFHALAARGRHDEHRMLAAFITGLRATWRPSAALALILLPASAALVALAVGLLTAQAAVAGLGLGVMAVVAVVGAALLLEIQCSIGTAMEAAPTPRLRVHAARGLLRFLRAPGVPLAAVVVGATFIAAAAQSVWVALLFAVSVPAWMVSRRASSDPDADPDPQVAPFHRPDEEPASR